MPTGRYIRARSSPFLGGSLTLLMGFLLSGCIALDAPDTPAITADAPRWSEQALGQHLSFLRQEALAQERAPGEPLPALRYIATRLHEYRVQPALHGSYQVPPPPATPYAVAGYVSGRAPHHAREMVLVCADLPGGAVREENTAALLELARNYSRFAEFGVVPERSVMFVIWRDGVESLRAYLENPTWSLADTRSVIYLRPGAERQEAARELLDRHDIPLLTVPLGDGHMLPVAEEGRSTTLGALSLAQYAHRFLRAEVLASPHLLPIRPDTLQPPRADTDQEVRRNEQEGASDIDQTRGR